MEHLKKFTENELKRKQEAKVKYILFGVNKHEMKLKLD